MQKFVRATSPLRLDNFELIICPCSVRSFPYFRTESVTNFKMIILGDLK